jgi:hypothetical protein
LKEKKGCFKVRHWNDLLKEQNQLGIGDVIKNRLGVGAENNGGTSAQHLRGKGQHAYGMS